MPVVHFLVVIWFLQALEKSKYEQSLETVRHFIAIAEKELELYHRHIALYGDSADHNPNTISSSTSDDTGDHNISIDNPDDKFSASEEDDDDDYDVDGDDMSLSDTNCTGESSTELDSCNEETLRE